MLGTGSIPLEYKPRKKKGGDLKKKKSLKDKIARTFTSIFKSNSNDKLNGEDTKLRKRPRKEVEKDHMDKYWIDYDYELQGQKRFEMPPRIVYDDSKITKIELDCK
jgi:hypothetical protein